MISWSSEVCVRYICPNHDCIMKIFKTIKMRVGLFLHVNSAFGLGLGWADQVLEWWCSCLILFPHKILLFRLLFSLAYLQCFLVLCSNNFLAFDALSLIIFLMYPVFISIKEKMAKQR